MEPKETPRQVGGRKFDPANAVMDKIDAELSSMV